MDLDKLAQKSIVAQESVCEGEITCRGKTYHYSKGDAVLANGDRVIGLCGFIMDDSVLATEATTRVVALSTVFDEETVRATAARLGVRDMYVQLAAAATAPDVMRVVLLGCTYLNVCSDGSEYEAVEIFNKYDMSRVFRTCCIDDINQMLSTNFTAEEIKAALDKPELPTSVLDEKHVRTAFPSYRVDNQLCDIAQSLLCWLGCERIGERS